MIANERDGIVRSNNKRDAVELRRNVHGLRIALSERNHFLDAFIKVFGRSDKAYLVVHNVAP
jgi:UDP-N-acetyl-D-mannosaminuronic acid transferase (WecB/TagA/CpsF family)